MCDFSEGSIHWRMFKNHGHFGFAMQYCHSSNFRGNTLVKRPLLNIYGYLFRARRFISITSLKPHDDPVIKV